MSATGELPDASRRRFGCFIPATHQGRVKNFFDAPVNTLQIPGVGRPANHLENAGGGRSPTTPQSFAIAGKALFCLQYRCRLAR